VKTQQGNQPLSETAAIGAMVRAGDVAGAKRACEQALLSAPDRASLIHLRGVISLKEGQVTEAINFLERAHRLQPSSFGPLNDLGAALSAAGRYREASAVLSKAVEIRPEAAGTFLLLAAAQLELEAVDDALLSYEKALSINPSSNLAAHMVRAIREGRSGGVRASYVPRLFDEYAERFDRHLDELGYRVPQLTREKLGKYMPNASTASVFDVGCGTGLVGVALNGLVANVDGIDISAKMVEVARRKNVYRNVQVGDLTNLPDNRNAFDGPYDVITAADVFIYVGRLEQVFPALRMRLRKGGLLIFSTESADLGEVAVRASGRFAHNNLYIENIAAQNGLEMVDTSSITVRAEAGVPIGGFLYVLRAS
jgi:predicted TPR repeat methyltransferase